MSTKNSRGISAIGAIFDRIRGSPIVARLQEIPNLPLILAIVILAICLLVYSGHSREAVSKNSGESDLELRLSAVLSAIEGAGEVECMIYTGDESSKDVFWGAEDKGGEIMGVIIVAEGAKDIAVMLRLKDAAATALNVEPTKVQVYKKQQK